MDGFIHLQGEDLYRDDVNKISFILSRYQDHLDSQKEFPHLIANTWGGKGEVALYGDLGPTGITKRHAIEVLLDYLGADQKDTISFGDAKIDYLCLNVVIIMWLWEMVAKKLNLLLIILQQMVNDDGLYNAFRYLKLID